MATACECMVQLSTGCNKIGIFPHHSQGGSTHHTFTVGTMERHTFWEDKYEAGWEKTGKQKKVVVCGWLVGKAQHLHLCFWPTLVACGHNYTRLHWREHTTKRTVPAIDTSGTHPLRNSKYVNKQHV